MIISLRQISRFLRLIVLVVLFSFICYKILTIVHGMIQPTTNKYKEPVGSDAVKVSAKQHADTESDWQKILDRLAVFYQIGE